MKAFLKLHKLVSLKALGVSLVCGFAMTTSQTALAQLSEPYLVRSTLTDCLNVRPTSCTSGTPIACLAPGTPVTVVSAVPYWREITFNTTQRGWAAKKYLEPASPPVAAALITIPADAFLEVHFVDVGQGDAIWITTHDDGIDGNGVFEGYSIVIDGGPYSSDNSNPMLPYMEQVGHHGAEIEALIVTHPHTDHFRGAETLSRHFDIRHYYDPGFPSTLSSYAAFRDAMVGTPTTEARAEHSHMGIANFGTIDWGDELEVEVLNSWSSTTPGLGSGNTRVNNSSIVLRLEYGEHTFLFMGDAEGKDRGDAADVAQYVESILLQNVPARLDATVLKVGHHGSQTSSTDPFIDAVNPSIVIIQSGRRNFNGAFIPDSATLQRFCDHNPAIRIYRTDQNDEADGLSTRDAVDGDHIVIRTNGTGDPTVTAMEGGQPLQVTTCAAQ